MTPPPAESVAAMIRDMPAPPDSRVKVFSHLLGESGTTIFAAPALARRLRRGFPASLREARMLLPMPTTALRRALEQWFESLGIAPAIDGEFEDSALLKAFGESGRAAFPAAAVIAPEVCRHYRVAIVGHADAVRERYYALSAERRVTHPGVIALSAAARIDVFAEHAAESQARPQPVPRRKKRA